MSRVACFLIESARRSRWILRRYSEKKCTGKYGYHNAQSSFIGETDDDPTKQWLCSNPPTMPPGTDERWPKTCEGCGYEFTKNDPYQVHGIPLYRNPETGEVKPRDEFGPGAMWDCVWYHDVRDWKGADGHSWMVMLPDSCEWHIDGPAKDGSKWSRTGTAPLLTVRPSILAPNYHGFLTNGVLESC